VNVALNVALNVAFCGALIHRSPGTPLISSGMFSSWPV